MTGAQLFWWIVSAWFLQTPQQQMLVSHHISTSSGPITRLDHDFAQATSQGGTATTPAMSCSGGNFVAAWVVSYAASAASATVTSSPSNTWTAGTNAIGPSTNANGAWFRAYNASTSGSMTVSATGNYTSVFAICYSNVLSSSD